MNQQEQIKLYEINYNNYPKGTRVRLVWGCDDVYVGFIIKNLKYKLVIKTLTKEGNVHIETRDFLKEYVRSIEVIE